MFLSRSLLAGATAVALVLSPMAARAETLTEALASAYANNPDITSALLSVKSTAENIALSKSAKLPTIGLGVDYTHSANLAGGEFNSSQSIAVGGTYSHRLFDNFQSDAEIEQARALTEVSAQALRNAEQNVLLSVVEAYMSVVRDTQLVQLRQESVEFFRAQVKSTQDRLEIGEGTRIDVSLAEARLAQGVASYTAAVTSLQSSRASYERWVGHGPKNLNQNFRFGAMLPKSLDEALAIGDAQHPAILTAYAQVRAAQAGTDAARAAFGPTLDLIGNIGATSTFGNGQSSTVPAGSVRLSLSIPIYAGGALGASVRRANLDQIRSEVDAQSARNQVREAIITSWATMQNATAQIESAQSAVQSGQLVLEGIIQERDVGQRTTLDVLNSQAELTTAREALISASASRIIDSFTLVAAVGRLSAQDLGLPVEIKSADGYIAKVEDVWQELRSLD